MLGRAGGGRDHGGGPLLGPAAQDQVVQVAPDALAPPGRAHGQVGQGERTARVLGGDRFGQRGGELPPPGRRGPQWHPERVPDQVAAVAGLRQGKAGLAELHLQPGPEPLGVVVGQDRSFASDFSPQLQ